MWEMLFLFISPSSKEKHGSALYIVLPNNVAQSRDVKMKYEIKSLKKNVLIMSVSFFCNNMIKVLHQAGISVDIKLVELNALLLFFYQLSY